MAARLLNVIRRGGIFHFRRVVPVALRSLIGRSELMRSLSTKSHASARLRADLLYRHSERLFTGATMFSPDEIGQLVREFYQLTLAVDDHRRLLPDLPWSPDGHQDRSEYLDRLLVEQLDALKSDNFDKADPVARVLMARRDMSEEQLGPGRYNQIRQAILRASIDVIGELRARQDGDFNYEPQDRLLRAALVRSEKTASAQSRPLPEVAPAATARTEPSFSEVAEAFRSDQLAIKRWDHQTAAQARATYRLFVVSYSPRTGHSPQL